MPNNIWFFTLLFAVPLFLFKVEQMLRTNSLYKVIDNALKTNASDPTYAIQVTEIERLKRQDVFADLMELRPSRTIVAYIAGNSAACTWGICAIQITFFLNQHSELLRAVPPYQAEYVYYVLTLSAFVVFASVMHFTHLCYKHELRAKFLDFVDREISPT